MEDVLQESLHPAAVVKGSKKKKKKSGNRVLSLGIGTYSIKNWRHFKQKWMCPPC